VKSERYLVSQRYAQALIALVLVDKASATLADEVGSDLNFINRTIANSSDLRLLLDHPAYSMAQKKSVLHNIFMGEVQEISLCLLGLLVNRRRLDLLPSIERQYDVLLKEKRNIVIAQLTSAEQLSENNLADIKARLNEYLGKTLQLNTEVDSSLIAGYVLRIKDQIIDGSLKGRLAGIEKVLLSV